MEKFKANLIIERLERAYPDAHCELNFSTTFELLVATILSAQCTDKRVNEVTNVLFKEFNTPQHFALMDYEDLQKRIYSCGFYKNKAKNIIDCARVLIDKYNGIVPDNMDELIALPGVGRKTANVVLSNAFGSDAIAVDTHVFRTSRRLGFSNGKTPLAVEKDLTALLEAHTLSKAHHLLIFHGRYCCKSRQPQCNECNVVEFCRYLNADTDEKKDEFFGD